MEQKISIRMATSDDAQFIAKCVLASVDLYDFNGEVSQAYSANYHLFTTTSAKENTLYSYANTLIAENEGKIVGCMVAHSGEDYPKFFKNTFGSPCASDALEAFPGEFYLNAMAVIPEFRGHKLGLRLMEAQIDRGLKMGYTKFSLLVSQNHPKLQKYYEQLGFRQTGEVTLYGCHYNRCVMEKGSCN